MCAAFHLSEVIKWIENMLEVRRGTNDSHVLFAPGENMLPTSAT